jgi:hypothetical protein
MSTAIRSDDVLFEKIEKSTDSDAVEPICCTVTIGQCLPYYGDSCPQVQLYPTCKMAPCCPEKKVTAVHSTTCGCCCFSNTDSFYGEGDVNTDNFAQFGELYNIAKGQSLFDRMCPCFCRGGDINSKFIAATRRQKSDVFAVICCFQIFGYTVFFADEEKMIERVSRMTDSVIEMTR